MVGDDKVWELSYCSMTLCNESIPLHKNSIALHNASIILCNIPMALHNNIYVYIYDLMFLIHNVLRHCAMTCAMAKHSHLQI